MGLSEGNNKQVPLVSVNYDPEVNYFYISYYQIDFAVLAEGVHWLVFPQPYRV